MWRALTQADVEGVMSATELAAYQTAAIGTTQDPMADAIAVVSNQCRGYIADNPANSLADGATLPDRVHMSALHLVRVELLTRIDMEVSKDRADAKRDAIRFFERVSDGKVAIEAPTGSLDSEGGSTPTITTQNTRTRIATRDTMAGL